MLQRVLYICFLGIFLSNTAFGQLVNKPENPIKIHLQPAASAKPGSTVEATLHIEINAKWHIFSEKPELKGITATQLALEPSEHFTVEKITFPKPEPVYSDVFQKNLNFYQNKIIVPILLKIDPEVSGSFPIQGTFKFQACSDQVCLPPASQKFSAEQSVL